MSDTTPQATPQPSPNLAIPALLANWLVPGLGFGLYGRWGRALAHLLIVCVTFGLGLLFHGGVSLPVFSAEDLGFNLINNFTFAIQMGTGLPAIVSLIANLRGIEALGGIPNHAFYELGGYYMVVAGALNYFALCNLYDRCIRLQPRFRKQELGEDEQEEEMPGSDSGEARS